MSAEQKARDRVVRLLADAGLTETGAAVSAAWQSASERHQKLSAVGPVSAEEEAAYQAAFDAYYEVYDQTGVWAP